MTINRRALLGAGLTSIAACGHASTARALTESLTDLGGEMLTAPTATIYTAREIVTLDPARPAAQAVAVIRDAGLDPDRTNPYGGAIALGHPVGATGAILTLRVAQDLVRRDLELGIVTMCIGGGQALAALFRRI